MKMGRPAGPELISKSMVAVARDEIGSGGGT